MSVLIKGGRVVTAADDYVADVFVEDESVTLIGESLDVQADRVIDATGKVVLPGCIDPHTHLDMPFGGTTSCDDFTSGTVSAAFGGTTCHVDFCIQGKGQTFAEALETWHGKIESAKPVIDVGFHLAVTDLHEGGTLEELARMPDEGVTSYKPPRTARAVDVQVDVLVGILRLEVDQLGTDQTGDLVVDRRLQKDDVVLEQPAVQVVGPLAATRLLDDVGDEVTLRIQVHACSASVAGSMSSASS